MQNLFGIDNNDPLCRPNAEQSFNYDVFAIHLQELLAFAPSTEKELKEFAGLPENQHVSSKNMPSIFAMLQSLRSEITPKEIAKLALRICRPYKYCPYWDSDEKYAPDWDVDYIDEDLLIFDKNNIDEASSDYLLLQYEYTKTLQQSSCGLFEILDKLPKKLPDEIKNKVANNFTNQKRDRLISPSKNQRLRIDSDDYLLADLSPSEPLISQSKSLKFASIYDFFICHGLLTTPNKWNPFLNYCPPLEPNEEPNIEAFTDMKKFLDHFFPTGISIFNQGPIFNATINYLVERITNANLINKVFKTYKRLLQVRSRWWRDVPFPLLMTPLVNYPLPAFRSRLMQYICDTLEDPVDCGAIITSFQHHNFLYFPLLRRWFNLLIQAISPVAIIIEDFSDTIIEPLFDAFTHQPKLEPFPLNLSKKDTLIYSYCHNIMTFTYAQELHRDRNNDFIADNPPLNQQSAHAFVHSHYGHPELEEMLY